MSFFSPVPFYFFTVLLCSTFERKTPFNHLLHCISWWKTIAILYYICFSFVFISFSFNVYDLSLWNAELATDTRRWRFCQVVYPLCIPIPIYMYIRDGCGYTVRLSNTIRWIECKHTSIIFYVSSSIRFLRANKQQSNKPHSMQSESGDISFILSGSDVIVQYFCIIRFLFAYKIKRIKC